MTVAELLTFLIQQDQSKKVELDITVWRGWELDVYRDENGNVLIMPVPTAE